MIFLEGKQCFPFRGWEKSGGGDTGKCSLKGGVRGFGMNLLGSQSHQNPWFPRLMNGSESCQLILNLVLQNSQSNYFKKTKF